MVREGTSEVGVRAGVCRVRRSPHPAMISVQWSPVQGHVDDAKVSRDLQ